MRRRSFLALLGLAPLVKVAKSVKTYFGPEVFEAELVEVTGPTDTFRRYRPIGMVWKGLRAKSAGSR